MSVADVQRTQALADEQLKSTAASLRSTAHLYPITTPDPTQQKRQSAATTRKLRLLHSHGLIKKVPRNHRYVLTERGREIITTLLAARCADAETLLKAA